jgi:hypothetical protein
VNRDLWQYFDNKEYNNVIMPKEWMEGMLQSGLNRFPQNEIQEIFRFIDCEERNIITINQFKYYFYTREELESEAMNCGDDENLDMEFGQLFKA